jgi:hypothetical protein
MRSVVGEKGRMRASTLLVAGHEADIVFEQSA